MNSGSANSSSETAAKTGSEADLELPEKDILRLAMRASRMGTWVRNLEDDSVQWSPELEEIFGLPRDGFGGSRNAFHEKVHPEDLTLLTDTIQQAIERHESYVVEFRFRHSSGEWRWMDGRGKATYDSAGRPIRLYGVGIDITERKQAELARAHLAEIVESSENPIISKTLDGVVTSWNRGATRLFGYEPVEMIGQSITKIIPLELRHEEQQILAQLKRGQRIQNYETVRVTKHGRQIHVSIVVSPVRDDRGVIVGASKIVYDFTERKQIEEALHEADRRKDEFLATLAHELRNPLAPIRQAAIILKSSAATEAQKRWSHDVISRQVQHMSLLLDDLLDISRITRGTFELRKKDCELASIVDAAIETARPAIDAKRHTLTIDMPHEPVYVSADPLRLAQVLANLVTNAAKYTDPSGEIRLTVTMLQDKIAISIADNGIGITRDTLPNIFRMFSQVKSAQDRSEGGLGIGLALAKGLVELHGGTITAHSAGLGMGSEFTVELPAPNARMPHQKNSSETNMPAVAIRHKVLIADDNRDAAESLAVILRMEGYDVTVAYDGPEAIAAFNTFQPEFALLDIGMPGANGYEVAEKIRKTAGEPHITLIAVTGWGQDCDKDRARSAGFDYHFTKPLDPALLLELLQSEIVRAAQPGAAVPAGNLQSA